MRRSSLSRAAALVAVLIAERSAFAAGPFAVTNTFDTGSGSLRQAILDANAAGGGTINLNIGFATISLQHLLPVLSTPITINGNNADISGVGVFRVFFSDAPNGSTTTINQLTIRDGRALGGAGGLGGGGGGLGAGGGIFVARGNVTLNGVSMLNNSAKGGDGGASGPVSPTSINGGGGGGGLGGAGGAMRDPSASGSGGGGLYGAGQMAPAPLDGGRGGGSAADGSGTEGGGPGALNTAAPGQRYGGGGGSDTGGAGGPFGGGGGGDTRAGDGGFGGGGGGGGLGGFAGGNQGPVNASGLAGLGGAFAGTGSAPPRNFIYDNSLKEYDAGGGGGALGANVFAAPGATLTLNDVDLAAGVLTAGLGGRSGVGVDGKSAGTSLFLSGDTRVSVATNQTRTFAGSIVDIGDYASDPTAFGFNVAVLTKTGNGTLNLSSASDYRGGTVLSQGTLAVRAAAALGTGAISINDESTAASSTTLTVGSDSAGVAIGLPIVVRNLGTGSTTLASTDVTGGSAAFTGPMSLERSVTLLGRNNTPQDNKDSTGQTRFDGAITGVGGITIAGGHMVQLRGANTYAGATNVTANSTLSIFNSVSAAPSSHVTVDAGSTLILEGTFDGASFASLDGAGTLRGNGNVAISNLNIGQTASTPGTHTFTGPITGLLAINFYDPGAQTIAAQTNTTLTLNVMKGTLRINGDLRVAEINATKSSAGQQAFDLNGHTIGVGQTTLQFPGLISYLNANVSASNTPTSADGFYDSTLSDSRKAIGVALVANLPTMHVTWTGDTNLDGKVNFDDLISLAQNYTKPSGLDWSKGDFNRDGTINFDDLIPLAQNYNIVGAPLTLPDNLSAAFAADWTLAQSLVPEPSVAVASLALFAPRRRRM